MKTRFRSTVIYDLNETLYLKYQSLNLNVKSSFRNNKFKDVLLIETITLIIGVYILFCSDLSRTINYVVLCHVSPYFLQIRSQSLRLNFHG